MAPMIAGIVSSLLPFVPRLLVSTPMSWVSSMNNFGDSGTGEGGIGMEGGGGEGGGEDTTQEPSSLVTVES
jgi:hypothetical protein